MFELKPVVGVQLYVNAPLATNFTPVVAPAQSAAFAGVTVIVGAVAVLSIQRRMQFEVSINPLFEHVTMARMYRYLPMAALKFPVFTLVVQAMVVKVVESVEVWYLIEIPVEAVFPANVIVAGPTAPHT